MKPLPPSSQAAGVAGRIGAAGVAGMTVGGSERCSTPFASPQGKLSGEHRQRLACWWSSAAAKPLPFLDRDDDGDHGEPGSIAALTPPAGMENSQVQASGRLGEYCC